MRKYLSLLFFLFLYGNSLQAQNLVSGEYFFNTDPGVGNGTMFTFSAADSVHQTINISTSTLAPGFHNLFLRVKNAQNVWSHHEGRQFYIIQPVSTNPVQPDLVGGEWFVDTDPGLGNATAFSFTQTDSISTLLNISTSSLSNGFHNLFIRVKNNAGQWSHYEGRKFYIIQPVSPTVSQANLSAGEYFVDTDPGIGNATSFSFSHSDSVSTLINPNIGNLTPGNHFLFIRVKNLDGKWSHYEGRSFYVCDDLLAAPNITGSLNYCQGETISLSGTPVPNATSYLWNGPNGYSESGLTFTRNNAAIIMSGEYRLRAIRSGGTFCDTSFTTVYITVNPTYTTNNPQTICFGESITVGANNYTLTGTYTDVLQSISGCDSTVTTQLTVIPEITTNNPQTLCFGEFYSINGNTYSSNGTYTDIFQSINGCDSTVTTVLTVLPILASNNPQIICTGGSYSIGLNTYTNAGTYTDILQSIQGCDSTVTTTLTVISPYNVSNSQTICQGESITIGTNTYTSAGIYLDVLQSMNGCDSIITTDLTVNPTYTTSNPQTICFGESYTINGNVYTVTGTYTDVLSSINGCDSIVTTILTVLPFISSNNPQTVCFGESYVINGNTYSTSGTYTDVFQAASGCDSTVTTNLTVLPMLIANNPQTICVGDSYSIGNSTYTSAGTYTDVLQSVFTCDSTVTTILTVNNPSLNPVVSIAGITLTAAETAATYQWIDCDNANSPIAGATTQSFTPTSNGNYAVKLTSTICPTVTETSVCQNINSVGLDELSKFKILVFPNPTNNSVSIVSDQFISFIELKDLQGKIIFRSKVESKDKTLELKSLSSGVYLLEVLTDIGNQTIRIIKQE